MTTRDKIRYVWDIWRPHRPIWAFLAFFTLVSGAVSVAYPLALKYVIDEVESALRASRPADLGRLLGVLALVALGRFVAGLYPAFRAWMNVKIEADIRSEVFARILEKDHRFASRFRTGDVVTRLTDDIGADYMKLGWFCCSGIFRAIDACARILFSLAAMLLLEPRLALLSMLPLPLMLWVFYKAQRRLTEGVERQQEALSQTSAVLESAFSGIRIVKAFSAEDGQAAKLAASLDRRIVLQLAVTRLVSLVESAEALAARAGQVVTLAVGGLLVAKGEVPLGTLYALYVYLDMIVSPMQDLPKFLVAARGAFVGVGRVEELRAAPAIAPEPPPAPGAPLAALERIESLSAGGIDFRYDDASRPALDGVRFAARRGERWAIVGAVGSGKTTLVKALAGLLPAAGAISVNERPFADFGRRAVRARLGYVPQDSLLFSDSIAGNIGLGRASAAEIEDAAALAQLRPDLERLPAGLATVLGERGSLISGGQRQRVAIARALVRRPCVLLLDDVTASLDARTEERFWDALDEARPDLLTIVTTHRRATVRRADQVLMLERGAVVDTGTPAELEARCPAYRELLATEAREESLAGV